MVQLQQELQSQRASASKSKISTPTITEVVQGAKDLGMRAETASFFEGQLRNCTRECKGNLVIIPVRSTDFGGSLPIFFTFFTFLPPTYRSTDFYRFFRGSTEFKFFLPIFLLFHVNYALTNVIFMYLW